MRTTRTFIVIAVLLLGCNKRNVPIGGECEQLEDCVRESFGCVKESESAAKGYCSKPCSIAPPTGQIVPGGPVCADFGMVCEKAATAHRTLGEAYCVKKR